MKQLLLLAAAALSFAQFSSAAACGSTNLTAYVSLGSTGCTIGGSTLSNFQILSGTAGATAVMPTSIFLTPVASTYNPGLTISTTQTASSGALLEILFTYQVSGQMYIGTTATLGGSSETGNGAVTGIENYCAGSPFSLGFSCSGTTGALVGLDGVQQSDTIKFGQVSTIGITDDFTLDSSGGGTASGGTFNNTFAAVPEPVTTASLGLGIALLAGLRLRLSKKTI